MIERIGRQACRICERLFPDPFVFAILLTFLTAGLAFVFTKSRPMDLVRSWQSADGFWSLLKFGMQMCLILVTGHALASTPSGSARQHVARSGRDAWKRPVRTLDARHA